MLEFTVFNRFLNYEQQFNVVWVASKLDWEAKTKIGLKPSWSAKQPCYVCSKERNKDYGIAGNIGKILANKNNSVMTANDLTRPVRHLLSYCDDSIAFPMDLMHTYFVGGVVPLYSQKYLSYSPNS